MELCEPRAGLANAFRHGFLPGPGQAANVSGTMGILRLFLAVSVLVGHLRYGRGLFGLSFLSGGLAVQTFFIISGFYMALVLNEKYHYKGSYGTFLLQRVLRLYPLYYAILLLILGLEAIATLLGPQPFGVYATWSHEPRTVALTSLIFYVLSNFTILGLDWLWFVQENAQTGQLVFTVLNLPGTNPGIDYIVNGPAWTLGVEMTFYLIAPFLVRRSIKVQMAWLLASLTIRSIFYWSLSAKESTNWTYCFFPSVLFFFLAGSIGYQVYRKHGEKLAAFARGYWWIFAILLLMMIDQMRLPDVRLGSVEVSIKEDFFWVYVPVAMLLVPVLFAWTHRNRVDRLIGELSYPFYLVHYHVIKAVEAWLGERHNAFFGPACFAITLAITYLLYRVVELRTEVFRERLFHRMRPEAKLSSENFPAEFTRPIEGRPPASP